MIFAVGYSREGQDKRGSAKCQTEWDGDCCRTENIPVYFIMDYGQAVLLGWCVSVFYTFLLEGMDTDVHVVRRMKTCMRKTNRSKHGGHA